jgi:hypothetical protein
MGFMAVQELDERGAELLAEFEIVDGRARRKPIEATVLGTKNFLLGGIQKVETIWTRGGSPTWKDYGGAVLDVAVVAGGVGLLAKEARAAEVAVGRTSPRVVAVNATRILRNVGAAAIGPVGNLAVLYVVLTHPTLIGSAVDGLPSNLGSMGPSASSSPTLWRSGCFTGFFNLCSGASGSPLGWQFELSLEGSRPAEQRLPRRRRQAGKARARIRCVCALAALSVFVRRLL